MRSGHLIAGRYRLEERLGAGGMGVVWRATDLELNRTVALKRSQSADNGHGGSQTRREARLGAGLNHPNVVTVFDVLLDGEDRWLVMEYLESRDLGRVLAEDGPLPPERVARIGAQLAAALAAMHEDGLVHRDVKPGNVLLTAKDTAKLTDLGIARWTEETRAGGAELDGTPGFLAPEVAKGEAGDSPADVFSLGATLFAAVEGCSPWGQATVNPYGQVHRAAGYQLEPWRLAGSLGPVLAALLRKRPRDRPSAAEAESMLREVASGSEATIRIPPAVRRRRWGFALAAAAVAAGLVAGTLVWRHAGSEPDSVTGDPRTADPCALTDPAALSRFGQARLDADYGNFNRCDVLVRLSPDPRDEADVRVELEPRAGNAPAAVTATPVASIDRAPERNGQCRRTVQLNDGYRIVVSAKHIDNRRAELCAMADAVTSGAVLVLGRGQIPLRQAEPPPGSLAGLDACALVSEQEVATALGGAATPGPGFGNWLCEWERGRRTLLVIFDRDQPMGERDGDRIDLSGRATYVEADGYGERTCEAAIVHRDYTGPDGKPMIEVVRVVLRDDQPGEQLCAPARAAAGQVAARLAR
ncbi:serine/threonine protein kinase [Crossiella sp. SN42]|uniref:serine/threonine-protein kinase n=1 Tax=Crossiella sp. SN42 TaxID=2944808 RepID=UPI00207C61E2|nr:serine/threonine-protein kinase [Crossiella sp. SN42]MCO1578435.1 serine/threonine protein kinase [Crossiella sp. SN42]